jgi:hypothetical protein
MYGSSYMFRHYIAIFRERSLVPSERCSIEKQSIEYCGLSLSQKVLGTLREYGNVMPKHVEATIHN